MHTDFGDDYRDDGFGQGLVREQRFANVYGGHARSCAYGGGGDCTCGAWGDWGDWGEDYDLPAVDLDPVTGRPVPPPA